MVAALTTLPVLGVPVPSKMLAGVDSLLSIVQMPAGVPTATFAIGQPGAVNAALFAIRMLAVEDASLRVKLTAFREAQAQKARVSTSELKLAPARKPARKKR
jgi:5-(carboxyamino)imidazole ribonucleotide mutase